MTNVRGSVWRHVPQPGRPAPHRGRLERRHASAPDRPRPEASDDLEPWQDDGQGHVFFTDAKVVTGQFAYDATGKIPLAQRGVAVLFKEHGSSDYRVETWNVARAAATGAWSATRADRVSFTTCGGSHNWADLAAGNWVGVYAGFDNPSPWGLALTYETRDSSGTPTQALVLAKVDITTQKITLGAPTLLPGPAIELDRNCGKSPYGALVFPLDADGDSLRVGPPVHMTVANLNYYDFVIQEPPKHVDWLPGASGADPDTGVLNVSRLAAFNVSYTDQNSKSFSTTTSKTSGQTWGGGLTGDVRATFGDDIFGLEDEGISFDFGFHASRYNQSQKSSFSGQDGLVDAEPGGGDPPGRRPPILPADDRHLALPALRTPGHPARRPRGDILLLRDLAAAGALPDPGRGRRPDHVPEDGWDRRAPRGRLRALARERQHPLLSRRPGRLRHAVPAAAAGPRGLEAPAPAGRAVRRHEGAVRLGQE